jgi:D-3-phosphoglycerate dehydrogenase / 2-oxoglutarate reductase
LNKIKVVITDYIEPDLDWETDQFRQMGLEFSHHQRKTAGPAELVAVARDADVVITNMAKITAEVIQGMRRCRLIIRHGIGYDNVDIAAASRQGIVVANVPDYCVEEVAEQAVMLILACQRKLLEQDRILRRSAQAGGWDFLSANPIYRLSGKTVGIVGVGRIGGTVYRMLQGFDLKFLVCDPYLSEKRRQMLGVQLHPLETLLRQSHIITIHTPLNAETHHLFGEAEFKMMKKTAILVNTARGGIVDLRALDRALRAGTIAYAGIDVYEESEPPRADFPLLDNPRAICTPHLSWLSEEAGWNIREKIVAEVKRAAEGQGPKNQVNSDVAFRPAPAP